MRNGKSRLTKNALCETFVQLVEERGYSRITVKDLTDRCGVTRNTFYYHFRDLQQLLEYAMTTRMQEVSQVEHHPSSPQECLAILMDHCTKYKNLIRSVYSSSLREDFMRALDAALITTVVSFIEESPVSSDLLPEEKEIVARFYKCMFMGLFMDWLASHMKYDIKTLADHYFRIAREKNLYVLFNKGSIPHMPPPRGRAPDAGLIV